MESTKHEITIIVLTYNSGKYLRETLNSLVSQRVNVKWNIFISDDGSSDETKSIILEYAETYEDLVSYRFNEKNLGIAGNWFTSIEITQSKYTISIAGDDFWIDDYVLQKQYDALECNMDASMSYFNGYKFNEVDTLNRSEYLTFLPDVSLFDIEYWMKNGFFALNIQCLMFRKSALPERFEKWMLNCEQEDWLLFFLLLLKGKCHFQNQFVSMYRVHSNNYTTSGNAIKKLKGGIELIKNINSYTNNKFATKFSNGSWRYERLASAYLVDRQIINFFKTAYLFFSKETNFRKKVNFIKTIFKHVFLGYIPKY